MDSAEYEHTQVQLRRLGGQVMALESLVSLLLATHPLRSALLDQFVRDGETFDGVALGEDFSDDELADFAEARRRVLSSIQNHIHR